MKGLSVSQIRETRALPVSGSFTEFLGETFYKISSFDGMPPFFMTIVSASDIWNYVWSNGGLTAGRVNSDRALFPYYTADKVSDARTYTGPYTAIKVRNGDETLLWEPFSETQRGLWKTERNLYKSLNGSKLYFEERNLDLGLVFQYGWTSSDAFGLVRHIRILNASGEPARLAVLDGCRNILPACITSYFQNDNSVLLDAYKKTDLDEKSRIAVFSMTSIVTDKAEPSEGLFANVGWFSASATEGTVHLSPGTPEAFRLDEPLPGDRVVKGERPSLFLHRELTLAVGEEVEWYQVLDATLDLTAIRALAAKIADRPRATDALRADVAAGSRALDALVARADGFQDTADRETCAHHEANVLFNIMRGGIFANATAVSARDFRAFAETRNRDLLPVIDGILAGRGEDIPLSELGMAAEAAGPQVLRLYHEYLPLTFSRRHGDPSRPWNRFSIEIKGADGKPRLNYQGNWRDIFQNWEALALSYPAYLAHMSAKFLNACTADGFNPYRITRDGIDWEVPEPDNPWSNIGYWGDHQIIYLAKLLEMRDRFDPSGLIAELDEPRHSTANVPYRLKAYDDIVRDPHSTIVFDHELNSRIEEDARRLGSDAKLSRRADGSVALVSATEKYFVLVLAKMANLVPGGGIWLNTQRPEWNDANNALAGYGLSIVTLCYLRRFLVFLEGIYGRANRDAFKLTEGTATFLAGLSRLYAESAPDSLGDPAARASFVERAGRLFEAARDRAYREGVGEPSVTVSRDAIRSALAAFRRHAEATIRANRRDDGLYHAYNTLEVIDGGMRVHYLYEMLEGQVAVLSSGLLSPEESLALLRALKTSALFRADQYSYILYPNRELPHFCARNIVPARELEAIPLVKEMLKSGDRSIAHLDGEGDGHFNPSFRNARDLAAAVDRIVAASSPLSDLARSSRRDLLALYERVFNHRSFTGRSGTFYAYEGLGSIYWHMVSKLLLAAQENWARATDPATRGALAEAYYDVRKGIGFNKDPATYGAFPTDPYSHTPAGQGAKQPGMTGQVKEEILTRFAELGVRVDEGNVSLEPGLLRASEFRPDGTLSFSWCGIAFEYRREGTTTSPSTPGSAGAVRRIRLTRADGTTTERDGNELGPDVSSLVFSRAGAITKVEAFLA
ncbi:MAG TPA: hypothetical protein PLU93_02040 [Treponemataceae bacterium]|nr:hypothetical protein [Treponemataceae bacterium]